MPPIPISSINIAVTNMPIVILCSLVGAYSVNNSMNDVVVAVGCGVLGVVLTKLEMPSTPVVLGLILGLMLVNGSLPNAYSVADPSSGVTPLLLFGFCP